MSWAGSVLGRFWARWPRQLRVTRPGWYYLALTVGMGFAALNTGNNLIFLTFGLMLGVIVASGLLSERCLRDLDVARRLPEAATSGHPVLVGLSVRNAKRGASFGLLVEDLATGGRCQFPLVRACETQQRSYELVAARRGRIELSGIRLATRFPFGLFEKSLRLDRPDELRVRPAPLPCLVPTPGEEPRAGEIAAATAGGGPDPWQLRLYRDGEDARVIAWAPTARAGQLIALDRERVEQRHGRLTLPASGGGPAFEQKVGEAAYLAAEWMNDGLSVSLQKGRQLLVEEGHGPGHLGRLLDALAIVEPLP